MLSLPVCSPQSSTADATLAAKSKLAAATTAGGMRIQQRFDNFVKYCSMTVGDTLLFFMVSCRRTTRPAGAAGRAPGGAAVPGSADATNFAHHSDEGQGFQL